MTEEFAEKVYDILVEYGGADPRESEKQHFIYLNCDYEYGCDQYRFQGYFGFGGKYLPGSNCITMYRENETPELLQIMKTINKKLLEIKK